MMWWLLFCCCCYFCCFRRIFIFRNWGLQRSANSAPAGIRAHFTRDFFIFVIFCWNYRTSYYFVSCLTTATIAGGSNPWILLFYFAVGELFWIKEVARGGARWWRVSLRHRLETNCVLLIPPVPPQMNILNVVCFNVIRAMAGLRYFCWSLENFVSFFDAHKHSSFNGEIRKFLLFLYIFISRMPDAISIIIINSWHCRNW